MACAAYEGFLVFSHLLWNGDPPNIMIYNTLSDDLYKSRHPDRAISLFKDILENNCNQMGAPILILLVAFAMIRNYAT